MTDPSLFIMQRYWSGEESDIEDKTDPSVKLEQVLKFAKAKKKHSENNVIHDTGDADAFIDTAEIIIDDSDHVPKKKNKSHSLDESISSVDSAKSIENEQCTATSIHCSTSENKKIANKAQRYFENPELIMQNEEHELQIVAPKKKKKKKSSQEKCASENNSVQNRSRTNAETELLSDASETEALKTLPPESSELFPVIKDVLNKQKAVVPHCLPDWLANPTIIKIDVNSKKRSVLEMDFLDETTKDTLTKCEINYLFPVQFKVIPWLLQTSSKRLFIRPSDLCVSAPTGSGKTLAFVIPIVQSLKRKVTCEVRALVVLPVKELAVQVFKVFVSFCKGTDLNAVLIVGNKSFQQEQNTLLRKCSRGVLCRADIIVATPGRVIDHINQTPGFNLKHLRYLVIDEADRMIDEIQRGWLKNIESAIYKHKANADCCFSIENEFQKSSLGITSACMLSHVAEPVQKLFYSATLSQDPEKLHELSLYRPKLFTSTVKQNNLATETATKEFVGKFTTPKGLIEKYVMCATSMKPLVICHLVSTEGFQKVLCFTQSIEHSHRLHLVLSEMLDGIVIKELSSNLRVIQRKIILQQFAAGKIKILVCSDLMARGMDIENVDCVISYDVPRFMKTYIHRVGRTARAGKQGTAITLLESEEIPKFQQMLSVGGKSLPTPLIVKEKVLASLEKSFKTALASASKTIASENHKTALGKKGIRKQFTNRKTHSQNIIKNGHI